MAEYVYGLTEASTFHDGAKVIVHKDEVWNADDPFVAARPDLFSAAPDKPQTTDSRPAKRSARRAKD